MKWAIGIAALAIGCGGPSAPRAAPAPVARPPVADAGVFPDAAPAIDAAPPVSELEARVELARRFRAAGLRIREDVIVAGVALDGCDPDRRVGYEYVAVEERGRELTDATRAALAALDGWHVLVVEATDAADLRARADAFLSALPARRSASGR